MATTKETEKDFSVTIPSYEDESSQKMVEYDDGDIEEEILNCARIIK